ncbi:MAG TPA: hypothetical protein VEY09_14770 [Pyrinomonadaceae bacterium]|nr:hypothetical protein [Pyrinomonadaceae bacterium]
MRLQTRNLNSLLLAATLVATACLPAGAQTRRTSNAPPARPQTAREWEQRINNRDREQNGIRVDEPKVYDDSMLQQMLTAAQAKLASMQVLDQGVLVQKLGAVSGASQQASSFGLTVQGPALPQVVTTSKGATQTVTESQQVTGSAGTTQTVTQAPTGLTTVNQSQQSAGSTGNLQTLSGAATQDVQQTRAAAVAPSVAAPPVSTSVPTTGFSVASSDILNEQMQLTYEIANLSLLIDGALSDRILMGKNDLRTVKPRITLGFPITLTPDRRHKNAVAVVEVEVEKKEDMAGGEAPTVTALLPREKTYNVASITEKNLSLGGGVVTQVMGVGGSWFRGNRTYYLVKDQDTLALTFPPDGEPGEKKKVGFLWQFRPVLGQEYVRSGLKQTFVQVAFPSNWSAKSFGNVTVRTYWRRYDPKKGVVKEVIPDSLTESIVGQPITNYTLDVKPNPFNLSHLEDLGNGQMLVQLEGRFMTGTYVRVGSQFLRSGSPATSFEYNRIRFVAPIADLATKKVALVSRDGTELPLEIEHKVESPGGGRPENKKAPIITAARVSTVDEANSRVELTLNDGTYGQEGPPLVMVIGGRVYGYSDAPLERNGAVLSAVVPTAWILAHPEVTVKPLFAAEDFKASKKLIDDDPARRSESLLLFEQGKSSAKFIIYGSRLHNLNVLYPAGVVKTSVGGGGAARTMYMVELTADQLKTHKQMVVQRGDERPFVIPLPALEFGPKPAEPKVAGRVSVGADEAVIQGPGFADLVRVTFQGLDVPFRKSPDGREVRLRRLWAVGATKTAAVRPLVLIYKDGVSTVSLEVVDSKVETVPR